MARSVLYNIIELVLLLNILADVNRWRCLDARRPSGRCRSQWLRCCFSCVSFFSVLCCLLFLQLLTPSDPLVSMYGPGRC